MAQRKSMNATLLRTPGAGLRYLVEHDAFAAVKPLSADRFVTYCKERGLDIDVKQLERLERLGVFAPIARVEYPRMHVKIEHVGENRIRHHGMLKEGEIWTGELREENSRFSFRRDWASTWLESDALWDPRERAFEPWATFRRDGTWEPRIESFYSPFQAWPLRGFLTSGTMRSGVDVIVEWKEQSPAKVVEQSIKYAEMVIRHARENGLRGDDAAFVAQAISNRYYFQTRTDRRTILVSGDPLEEWDWNDAVRRWDASAVAAGLGLSAEAIEEIHLDVSLLTQSDDPLARWYELVSFVAIDKRERLKGDARFAQFGYAIEHMLRLFHTDLTGKRLRLPHERHAGVLDDEPEDEVKLLDELQYTVNAFHLNPKAQLILVLEGDGEAQHIPRLARDLLGYDLTQVGIEVRNLRGIGEFTGSKKRDPYGALEKFIDDHHYRQTMVFCIFDKEGDAPRTKERLVAAESRFYPGRKLTRDEYIHLWEDSIEFDNFSDTEIAEAMTRKADGGSTFTSDEVATARAAKQKKGKPLHHLYVEKMADGLHKVVLLGTLVDAVIANAAAELVDPPPRPLVRLLLRVVELAASNHQPVSADLWRLNQGTGYLGEPTSKASPPPEK